MELMHPNIRTGKAVRLIHDVRFKMEWLLPAVRHCGSRLQFTWKVIEVQIELQDARHHRWKAQRIVCTLFWLDFSGCERPEK